MNEQSKKLGQIAKDFSLEIIYAFGSHAKDAAAWVEGKMNKLSFAPGSDLDIGVKPARDIKLDIEQKVELALLFEDLFSAPRVDLIVIPEVDPFIAANIIRGERIYAQDEDLANEYDLYILRRAGDIAPIERERIALIFGET